MSGEKNGSWQPESFCGPKDDRGKMPRQETLWQSKRMRSSACRWRTNCCGIFCTSQEGGERKGITGQRIDPDECIGTLQRYAFDRVFQEFAVWECEHIGDCLLCRLDSEVSARPLQREPKAALEQSLLTEDRERPLKRSAPPKSGRARSKCLCSVDRRASQESE